MNSNIHMDVLQQLYLLSIYVAKYNYSYVAYICGRIKRLNSAVSAIIILCQVVYISYRTVLR